MMIHNSYDFADSNSVVKLVPSETEAYLSIVPGYSNEFNSENEVEGVDRRGNDLKVDE
jgi:hypothetical protein